MEIDLSQKGIKQLTATHSRNEMSPFSLLIAKSTILS